MHGLSSFQERCIVSIMINCHHHDQAERDSYYKINIRTLVESAIPIYILLNREQDRKRSLKSTEQSTKESVREHHGRNQAEAGTHNGNGIHKHRITLKHGGVNIAACSLRIRHTRWKKKQEK